MDSLGFMSPRTADGFVTALVPLLIVNGGLRDHLMLVLRKTMFAKYAVAGGRAALVGASLSVGNLSQRHRGRRTLEARLIAMNGFMRLVMPLALPASDAGAAGSAAAHAAAAASSKTAAAVVSPYEVLGTAPRFVNVVIGRVSLA